jgi:hypothetical protein
VETNVTAIAGGVEVAVPDPGTDDPPTLRIDGFAAFGGVAVGAKPIDG